MVVTMKCLLDMDGVITDFHISTQKWFDIPDSELDKLEKPWSWSWVYGASGHTETSFWEKITIDFWETLDWTPEGREILELCERKFGKQIQLCTYPMPFDVGAVGKQRWIEKHLPQYKDRVIYVKDKSFLAHPGMVLIDDSQSNCEAFLKAGGNVIIVPRPWNNFHGHNVLEHLESEL